MKNMEIKRIIGEYFKKDIDFYSAVVKTPNHFFSITSDESGELERAISKFKQRWKNLVTGKRNNPVDIEIEDALRKVLEPFFTGSIAERESKWDFIQKKLRESGRELFFQNSRSEHREEVIKDFFASRFTELVKRMGEAESAFIVFEKIFAAELFSSNEANPLTEIIWNAIILKQKPLIRFYAPWGDGENIWTTLEEDLKLFLIKAYLQYSEQDENGGEFSLMMKRYLEIDTIAQFFREVSEDEKKKSGWRGIKEIAMNFSRKILSSAYAKSYFDQVEKRWRRRILIVEAQLPKMFATCYVILNPENKPSIFSIVDRPQYLEVIPWESSHGKKWAANDKKFWMYVSEKNENNDFIKLIPYKHAVVEATRERKKMREYYPEEVGVI